MKTLITQFAKTLNSIAFPLVCACCNSEVHSNTRFICDLCLLERFDMPDDLEKEILPEHVEFLHTMWSFDKGGYLQQLMHKLKYDFLKGVGTELGRELGRSFKQKSGFYSHDEQSPYTVIVPVPLYPKKQRRRGYNQARSLAEGFSSITGWPVAEEGTVIRTRHTKTQTGLDNHERKKNISNAFKVNKPDLLSGSRAVIIDDVYTTGATTFELARIVSDVTGEKTGIVTVAKA